MIALEILILVVPVTLWALWNDRNGDDHKNLNDILLECLFMVLSSLIVKWIGGNFLKALLVSITGFGLIFPPLMNWRLAYRFGYDYEDGRLLYIFNHLSRKAWPDRLFLKYGVHWLVRLVMYLSFFVGAIILFVK